MNDSVSIPAPVNYPVEMRQQPFFDLTVEMLDCVRDHNFKRLAEICDDDFGIVDIDTEGGSRIIRNRTEWKQWFTGLFRQLDGLQAVTWSEVARYEALKKSDMGYSVVDFDQMLMIDDKRMRFSVIATIIWKKEGDTWRESRYHSSLTGIQEEN